MIDVEYSFNVGHWHVLGVLIAIMVVMILVDQYNIMGKLRQFIGWMMILGSLIGFGFTTLYMLRPSFAENNPDVAYDPLQYEMQQDALTDIIYRGASVELTPYVEMLFLWIDIGLAFLFAAVGATALFIFIKMAKGDKEEATKEETPMA